MFEVTKIWGSGVKWDALVILVWLLEVFGITKNWGSGRKWDALVFGITRDGEQKAVNVVLSAWVS